MEFVDNTFRFKTNLGDSCFDKLHTGVWKIGLFADNLGIDNENSDKFYEDVIVGDKTKDAGDKTIRCFKNKVCCTLYDESIVDAHIIHWHKSGRWFSLIICTIHVLF